MPIGNAGGGSATASIAEDMYFADIAARDSFTTLNPSRIYQGVACAVINGANFDYFQYDLVNTQWRDANLIYQGPRGESDIDGVEDGQIPVKEGTTLVSSGMQRLPNGQILAPKKFGVESASIDFGDVITVSEQSSFLGIRDNSNGQSYVVVDFERNRDAPSENPRIFRATEAESPEVIQPDDSTELTGTSLTFDYTTTLNAYTNAITLKALNAMTNVRIKVTQQGGSIGLKYIPDKSAWLSGVDGLNFVTGDNEIDIFDSSLALESGTTLTVEIKADSISLLGSPSGVPYLSVKKQDAVFNSLVVKGMPIGALGGDTVSVLPNTSVSTSFLDPATTETITLNLDDGNHSGDTIEFVFANNLGTNTVVFNASSPIGFFNTNTNTFDFSAQLTLTGRSARVIFEWYGNDWRIIR